MEVHHYILSNTANCHAQDWWEGNYVSQLYPQANFSSQRISDFLVSIGNEGSQRDFFSAYLPLVSGKDSGGTNTLIDSSGLPNSIHFPLTAISNHNGEINNEIRLIYVTHQETGLPIYFRYSPGNVVDVSTLTRTIAELKANGVNTKFSILDASYYTEENIRALYTQKISFITRLKENRKVYKQLLAEHMDTLQRGENFVSYNDRYVYIECVECTLIAGYTSYAYIGMDISRKGSEAHKLFKRTKEQGMDDKDVYKQMEKHGIFILVSSRRIARDKILPHYYIRQQIEQIFDIGKNYADILPIRVQTEEAFRGHMLLTFISSVLIKQIQCRLKRTAYNPISLFLNLRNHI